jgi:hypothetical protein
MLSTKQLIEEAQDERLRHLPLYARKLIHDLAVRLGQEAAYSKSAREKAEQQVDAARKLLNEGPADSNTFLSLGNVMGSNYGEDGREDERPLGSGPSIEFRDPSLMPGEGFSVRMKNGRLEISGINVLAITPVHSTAVTIGMGE